MSDFCPIQTENARHFRQLHQAGNPFILANAWDIGSARMLAALGASAIATTSAGHAYTLGRADSEVTRDETMSHAAQLVTATVLPVSGDCENGYGHSPEEVAITIRMAIAAGLSGCSIEDTMLPATTPYSFDDAITRIKAAITAARTAALDFVITARADGLMLGQYDVAEASRRLHAFAAAGADVVYAPMLPNLEVLEQICSTVSAPVNALVAGDFCNYTLTDFARVGVARVSLGSSLARTTHTVINNSATQMFSHGDFASLLDAANGDEIDDMLKKGSVIKPN